MHQTYLLLSYNGVGHVDEIIGTFDTTALAKECVASGIGQDVDWVVWPGGGFITTLQTWHIIPVPHNQVDARDWAGRS